MPRRTLARPSTPVMVIAAASVFAVLVTLSFVSERGGGSQPAPTSNAQAEPLLAYADSIYPGAQLAGRVIVAGIRADIADFESGRISLEVWNADLTSRQRELREAQEHFDDATAPASVGDAPAWFRRAFTNYQRAIELLLLAGTKEGAERAALIERAADVGEAGDDAFDHGTARIQAARRALGLGPDVRFSDKAVDER